MPPRVENPFASRQTNDSTCHPFGACLPKRSHVGVVLLKYQSPESNRDALAGTGF